MHCSLFGKLPARRDFIAVKAPREFLAAWEPWLQSAISSSRNELGKNWQPAFLTAPIWRFWLGEEICGRTVVGALMCSLDGVGRYFPLTLFACADDAAAIPAPEFEPHDRWFDEIETFLVSTLDQDADFEAIAETVGKLTTPVQHRAPADSPADSAYVCSAADELGQAFASMRAHQPSRIYANSTFWWTIGGDNFPVVALCCKRMPDPYIFSRMLTGEFARVEGRHDHATN